MKTILLTLISGFRAEVTAPHEAIPAHSISQDGTVTLD